MTAAERQRRHRKKRRREAREAPAGYDSAHSAAVMRELTDLHKSLVDEALYLRGRIVAAYAQVEFLLADISVQLDLRFPYRVKDRIKAVKRIADREGYGIYKQNIDRVCDELLQYDDLRHFMTHGFLSLEVDKQDNHKFEFRRYQRESSGQFNLLTAHTTIERLKEAANDITEYVSNTVRLFERIYREQKLET